jgi:hypothetical protein
MNDQLLMTIATGGARGFRHWKLGIGHSLVIASWPLVMFSIVHHTAIASSRYS